MTPLQQAAAPLRVAYLVNQYPKVSHSFIRREILALESGGLEVLRLALRGWDAQVEDAQDKAEQAKTRYVLQGGPLPLAVAMARAVLASPMRFAGALGAAWRLSRGADKPLPYHLVYLAEACRVLHWLRQAGAGHLHAHFGTNAAEVALLVRRLGGPTFSFTVHGPEEFDKPQQLAIGPKVHEAAFVVAVSSFGRSQLYRHVAAADWPKIVVVHCGLEAAFHAVPPRPLPATPRLVCVGRLCEQKGQLLLVDAAAHLARAGIEFELVLAGDGDMRQEIERRIAEHGLQRQVRITGWVSSEQVSEEILSARALVLPSFAEGLPVVLMEAMSLRRPVLSTYVAGIPELVRNGVDGWLFPAGAVEEAAQAMQQCLEAPAHALQAMGDAAYARALQRHSITTEAAKLAALFRRAGAQCAAGT